MIFLFRPQTQYENLGDAYIAKNLIEILSKKGTVYIDDKGVPDEYLEIIMNSSSLKVSQTGKHFMILPFILRMQKNNVQYVFKPGHLYGGTNALGGWRRILSMLLYFSILRVFGVKLLKTGVSIGPLSGGYKFYEKMINKLSSFTGVRENKSFEYLNELKVKNNTRVRDLAFYSFPTQLDEQKSEREYLSFSFRKLENSKCSINENAEKIATILYNLKLLIELKHKKNIKIALITQVQRDHQFNEMISECLEQRGYRVEKKLYYEISRESYSEISCLYSKSMFVVSNRLHALLFGLNYGAFPIGVGDEKENFKVKYILDDTNLNNTFFNIDSLEKIESMAQQILSTYDENDIKNAYQSGKLEDNYIVVP